MDCSMTVFPVLHYLLEFAQTHVHWVGDAIQQGGWASSNQLKDLRKRLTSLKEEEILLADCLQSGAVHSTLSWVSSLPDGSADFGLPASIITWINSLRYLLICLLLVLFFWETWLPPWIKSSSRAPLYFGLRVRKELRSSTSPLFFICMSECWVLLHQTFCDPMDCSLPGSSVHAILQARILEWVAISFSGDLPNPRIKPTFSVSPALAGRFFTSEPPGKPFYLYCIHVT